VEEVALAGPDGTIEVVVLPEVGARLHRLRAFGHDLLRAPDDPAEHLRDPLSWGAYVMAPWCNRVASGPVSIAGRRVELAANFADRTAIHGQVHDRPWERLADGTFRVRGGGEGWPWAYEVSLGIGVGARSVRLDLGLTNLASDPMPAGLGLHPWFRRPVLVAVRGDLVHPSNTVAVPIADPEPVRGSLDLRALGEMAAGLDATWTGLADPAVELAWPEAGVRAEMRIDTPSPHVAAAAIVGLDAIAVEPQTHAPQGLRRLLRGNPGALAMLDPGATLPLGIELRFERLDDWAIAGA